MFQVRPATPDDAVAVGAITRAVYLGDGFADVLRAPAYVADLSNGRRRIAESTVFVASMRERVVGSVAAVDASSGLSNLARIGELEVRMLGVLEGARGCGVATALMHACHVHARDSALAAVVLSTDPLMVAARHLYETLGYLRTPERDWCADGVELITYRLPL